MLSPQGGGLGRDAWRLQGGGGWWLAVVRTAPSRACEVGVSDAGAAGGPAVRAHCGPRARACPWSCFGRQLPAACASGRLPGVPTCPSGKRPWGPHRASPAVAVSAGRTAGGRCTPSGSTAPSCWPWRRGHRSPPRSRVWAGRTRWCTGAPCGGAAPARCSGTASRGSSAGPAGRAAGSGGGSGGGVRWRVGRRVGWRVGRRVGRRVEWRARGQGSTQVGSRPRSVQTGSTRASQQVPPACGPVGSRTPALVT